MRFRSKMTLELLDAFCWTIPYNRTAVVTGQSRYRVILSLNLMRRQEMSLQHGSETPKTPTQPQPKVCGSLVDAQGREIPITEQMIQQACKDLEQSRVERVKKD